MFSEYIGLPMQNVDKSYVQVGFKILPDSSGPYLVELHSGYKDPEFNLAPGQITILPLRIRLSKRNAGEGCVDAKFKVEISPTAEGKKFEASVQEIDLRCRTSDQSFVFTFLDFDHTVSYPRKL